MAYIPKGEIYFRLRSLRTVIAVILVVDLVLGEVAEAIQAAPEEPALYLLRAFCWKGLEHTSSRSRTPDMLRDLTRALELEPDNQRLKDNLALMERAAEQANPGR